MCVPLCVGLQGNSLVFPTFLDGTSLITSISMVKDFILVGTCSHSMAFLKYKMHIDTTTQ